MGQDLEMPNATGLWLKMLELPSYSPVAMNYYDKTFTDRFDKTRMFRDLSGALGKDEVKHEIPVLFGAVAMVESCAAIVMMIRDQKFSELEAESLITSYMDHLRAMIAQSRELENKKVEMEISE